MRCRLAVLPRYGARAHVRAPGTPVARVHATARTGEGCRPACAACLRFNSCPDTGGGAGASRSRSHARGASSVITRAVAAQARLQWPQLASRWLETRVALTFAHASRQAALATGMHDERTPARLLLQQPNAGSCYCTITSVLLCFMGCQTVNEPAAGGRDEPPDRHRSVRARHSWRVEANIPERPRPARTGEVDAHLPPARAGEDDDGTTLITRALLARTHGTGSSSSAPV